MLARFDYLPDQYYVPIGVLDQAEQLRPQMHCHADAALPWLHIADDLPRHGNTGRNALTGAKP